MKVMWVVVLAAIAACVTTHPAKAQETINYGTISGRVIDPQGAVVPGAVVVRPTD